MTDEKHEAEPEAVPEHEGPDPHKWPGIEALWTRVRDVQVADEALAALSGDGPQNDMSGRYDEARDFMRRVAAAAREALAVAILHAHGITLDENGMPPGETPAEEGPAA